jgi:uncharacterized protein (DUF1501 family)
MDNTFSRREFLRRASLLGLSGLAAPMALNLSMLSEAVAATAPTDYKALVCIFLSGGNDSHNMLMPYDPSGYAAYAAARQALATAQANIIPLGGAADQQLGLAPQMRGLQSLFAANKLGVISNIGPLLAPTTKSNYLNKSVPLPPKLMSHNDQSNIWLSGAPEGAGQGWGGRIADLYMANNSNQSLTCVMTGGSRVFLSGRQTSAYTVSTGAPTRLLWGSAGAFGSNTLGADIRALLGQTQINALAQVYVDTCQRGITTADSLASTYAGIADPVGFPASNELGDQLKAVARMIKARGSLGNKRQVFMVQLGGFDLHDNLLAIYPALLQKINDAMVAFQTEMELQGVSEQVTTFTASEFGRTLSSNSDGSDHGWGAHHFVMGGAVQGGKVWGQRREPLLDGPNDIGQGRLIPDFATDQLAWSLAKWFGVADSDRDLILPAMRNFDAGALNLFGAA